MVETSRIRITAAGPDSRHSMSPQRWGALIGGGALALYGITRKSPLGMALAAGGGTVALLASIQKRRTPTPTAWTSILVNCSLQEVYQFWRNLENLGRFMNRIENVTVLDQYRSRWTAIGPMGRPIHWNAQIVNEKENELIAWRSLPGSDVQVDGEVRFQEAPAGRGTLINARVEYSAVPGMNAAPLKFLSRGANFVMRQDLRRFEALMEAGEIPTIEGQSHGPRDIVTGVMRVADPTRPVRPGSNLKEVFATRRSIA